MTPRDGSPNGKFQPVVFHLGSSPVGVCLAGVALFAGKFAGYTSWHPSSLASTGVFLGLLLLSIAILIADRFSGSVRAGADGIEIARPFARRAFVPWRRVLEVNVSSELEDSSVSSGRTGRLLVRLLGPNDQPAEQSYNLRDVKDVRSSRESLQQLHKAFQAAEVVASNGSVEVNEPNGSPYRESSLPTERFWEIARNVHADQTLRLRAADTLRERIHTEAEDPSFRQRIDEIAAESVDESFKKELRARALGVQK
ncbi:MAG: hypothetical protein KBF88_01590 [Polyangiaceae bacterium]|nr:hypothetical protein [Polyangiaceae bacterium]